MTPRHLQFEGVDSKRGLSFEWSHHWFLWLLGRALMKLPHRVTWQVGWRMALKHGLRTKDGQRALFRSTN